MQTRAVHTPIGLKEKAKVSAPKNTPPLHAVAASFNFRRKVSLKIETSEPVSINAVHGEPESKMLIPLTEAAEEKEAGAANVGFPKFENWRDAEKLSGTDGLVQDFAIWNEPCQKTY